MDRIKGWERRLTAALQTHEQVRGVYGSFDCFTLPADAIEAVTAVRVFADCRKYKTPLGAARMLRKKGFNHVGEAFASLFPELPVPFARRGDIGIIENHDGEICGGVFTSAGFKARGVDRLVVVPRSDVLMAYKVG